MPASAALRNASGDLFSGSWEAADSPAGLASGDTELCNLPPMKVTGVGSREGLRVSGGILLLGSSPAC